MDETETTVTQLLVDWRRGDQEALERLMPRVYDELRRIARGFLENERRNHTLEPTALVNEVYLRLVDAADVDWQSRAHFLGIAARLMRCVLVDHARAHRAAKRPSGGARRTSVDVDLMPRDRGVDLIALDDALTDLERFNPEGGRVVELRFFGGLRHEEIAAVLGIAPTTVKRRWKAAKLWLRRELGTEGETP